MQTDVYIFGADDFDGGNKNNIELRHSLYDYLSETAQLDLNQ
jgi:hypothetical protein